MWAPGGLWGGDAHGKRSRPGSQVAGWVLDPNFDSIARPCLVNESALRYASANTAPILAHQELIDIPHWSQLGVILIVANRIAKSAPRFTFRFCTLKSVFQHLG